MQKMYKSVIALSTREAYEILFPEEILFHFCTSLLLVLLVKGVLDVPNNMETASSETVARKAKVYYNSYVKSVVCCVLNCQVQTT